MTLSESLPDVPYYAVIFSSARTAGESEAYGRWAARMESLASVQPGFLGVESARGDDGLGITVSYWSSREAIESWGREAEHQLAQRLGKDRWYRWFRLRIARVESQRKFVAPAPPAAT